MPRKDTSMDLHPLKLLALALAVLSGPPLAAQELKERAKIDGHLGAVICLAFSGDGKNLAAGDANGMIFLADVTTGKTAAELAHDVQVSCVAFAPDGK